MQYLDQIGLKSFVNFVQGGVTKINRKEKTIFINDSYHIKYDLLFMMCGEMFQRPLRQNKHPFEENPDNVYIVNTPFDANVALSKLKILRQKNKKGQCK